MIPAGMVPMKMIDLQMLMGGGGSFSAGGPGKGMHSRLCKFCFYLAYSSPCLTICI